MLTSIKTTYKAMATQCPGTIQLAMKLIGTVLLFLAMLPPFESHAAKVYAQEQYFDIWQNEPIDTLMKMGALYHRNHQDSLALVCYTIVASKDNKEFKTVKEGLNRKIDAMTSLGGMYKQQYFDYSKAYSWLKKAQVLLASAPDKSREALILFHLSQLMENEGGRMDDRTFANALDMMKKSFHAAIKHHDYDLALEAYLNMIIKCGFRNQEDLIESETSMVRTPHLIPDTTRLLPYTLMLLDGIDGLNSGDYPKAEASFEKLYSLAEQLTDSISRFSAMVMAQKMMYITYNNQLDVPKCISTLKKMEDLALHEALGLHLIDTYNHYARFYRQTGDSANAEKYRLKYLEAKEAYNSRIDRFTASNANFIYELNAKATDMEEEAKAHERKAREISFWLAGACIAIAFMVYVILKMRSTARKNLKLYQQSMQIVNGTPANYNSAPIFPDSSAKAGSELQKHEAVIETETKAEAAPSEVSHAKSPNHEEEPADFKNDESAEKFDLPDDQRENLMKEVMDFMQSSPEVFSDSFSLESLAAATGIKRYMLSYVINASTNNGFRPLLNEIRLKEACRRLGAESEYATWTIQAVSESVGFKSRSNFVSLFKDFTGLSPSAFRKLAKNHG